MYACMYIWIYIYMCVYVCMYMNVYVCICIYMYIRTYVCIYKYVYACMFVYEGICTVCMYVCMYACIWLSMYVCTRCLAIHPSSHVMVSIDTRGMIEYWDYDNYTTTITGMRCNGNKWTAFPCVSRMLNVYLSGTPAVAFKLKTETDLYDLAKAKTVPCTRYTTASN